MRQRLLILATISIFSFMLVIAGCGDDVTHTGSDDVADVPSLLTQGQYIPDIATFLNIGGNSLAGVSWDGKDVYVSSSMSGSSQVFRLNQDGWPYQLTAFEDGIDFFVLSHNGQMGIVGASVGGDEQSQIYLMDTRTGRLEQLSKFEDVQIGSVVWDHDDRSIFYRSNEENKRDFFIYRMDVTSGKSNKIFSDTTEGSGYHYISDVSRDGSKMIVGKYLGNFKNYLYLLDIGTGEYEMLTPSSSDSVTFFSTYILPDNETIWLTCNSRENGMHSLATMKVGSPEITYVDQPWNEPDWEVEGLMFSRDFKTLVVSWNIEGFVTPKLIDFETMTEAPAPDLKGVFGGAGFDRSGNVYFSYSGPTRAPDVWKWSPKSEKLTQLTFATYAGIDRELFSEPELVKYKSFDGLEIPAFLYVPPGYKKGTPIPFVVHAHGGPESQYQPYFLRNVQYLILNGFGVFAVNPRGSSGYGREFMSLDNYKLRKNSLKDYKAGVDWLISQGYTEQGMIGIRGGSYGGYVVAGMITEYPDLFSAAIDIVGIVNFETFLENTRSYRRAMREAEYGPLSDREFLRSISPIHKAHLIKTPLLVVHGANDPRVPVIEARQIIAAVKKNGGAVDSLIWADEGHGSGKRVNTIQEYRKQVEFFTTYLKEGGNPEWMKSEGKDVN